MKFASALLVIAVGASAGCKKRVDEPTTPVGSGSLEARVAALEAQNKKYAEALEFLDAAYRQQKAAQQREEEDKLDPEGVFAVDVAADVAAGQVDGPASARVTIVKAFDFACPYCWKTAETMKELVKEGGGDVRVVYKNMVVHATAMKAHLASCAAAKQGKYLAFKDAFWEQGFAKYYEERDDAKLGEANILVIAKGVGLDMGKFVVDMGGEACKKQIAADMADLEKFQVGATPTFFVNGTVVAGAMPKEEFQALIDVKLALAKSSGVAGVDYYAKEVIGKGEKAFRNAKTPKP